MANIQYKSDYLKKLPKLSQRSLDRIEVLWTNWLADVKKFYPWPALESSIAKDLEAILGEQKVRHVAAKKGN